MPEIITPEIPDKEILLKNFFALMGIYGAIWTTFYLTMVFFFGFIVGSAFLVGIFLGLGSIWAMIIDVPVGIIQRHIPSKTMFITANIIMIVILIIFLYLVQTSAGLNIKLDGSTIEITRTFLTTGINGILLICVSLLYGTYQETYDVTKMAYFLNICDPSEYAEVMSKNNVYEAIGGVVGLLLSIAILSLQTTSVELIIFILIFLLVCVGAYIYVYFNNANETFNLGAVKNLHLMEKTKVLGQETSEYIKKTVSVGDFEKMKGDMSYIIMKPKELTQGIVWSEIIEKTKTEFRSIYNLIFDRKNLVPILFWATINIFIFGCWDSVVTTFLVDYLDNALQDAPQIKNIVQSGVILIGLLAIPAYGLQPLWTKQTEKWGSFNIIQVGSGLTGLALLGMAMFNTVGATTGLLIIVGFALLNSIGFAAGYPTSNSVFADEYSKAFAKKMNLSVIDADVSAAPLNILLNLASAIGLIGAGALISVFGFSGMFLIFGGLVILWWGLSFTKKGPWKLDSL